MTPRETEDARFRELMEREFPSGLVPGRWSERPEPPEAPADADPVVEDAGAGPSGPSPAEPSGVEPTTPPASTAQDPGFRSWTPAEEPDEEFVAPPAPPPGRWTAAGIAGTAGVVLPLLLVLLTAFGVQLPKLVQVLGGIGFFVGVGLLLYRLRQRPPTDGDGAVV